MIGSARTRSRPSEDETSLSPRAFAESAIALQIIVWSAAATYAGIILGNAFVSDNLQKLSMKLTIGAMTFNIILNVVVIPTRGYWGVSATAVSTEPFIVCMNIFFLERWTVAPHAIGDWAALLWLGRYFCDIGSSADIWSSLRLRHGDHVEDLCGHTVTARRKQGE